MLHTEDFKYFLKDVIVLLKANVADLKEKRHIVGEDEKNYIDARLLSYREIISSLKSQLRAYDIDANEIGLDELEGIIG